MTDNPPPQKNNAAMYLLLASVAFLMAAFGWKMMQPKGQSQIADNSAFNLDEVPQDEANSAVTYETRFEREAKQRLDRQGPGLAGFVPETGRGFKESSASKKPRKGAKASAQSVSAKQRAREKKVWSKYKEMYYGWAGKVMSIGRKYRKKSKIVKEIDRYFGGMPRFMALKKKHEAGEIDAYTYWRGVTSLPEFRNGVKKYAGSKDAIKAGVQMTGEILASKPPKALYRETFRAITEDDQIAGFMSENFWPQVTPKLPMVMMNTEMPPGSSVNDVQKVANDLSSAQVQRVNRLQAEAKKNYAR
jgi:hypothetical protein